MKCARNFLKGIKILYEDEAVLVIDKPAGLLTTHTKLVGRAAREAQLTAANVLTDYLRKGQWKSSKCAFLVHRLDRETSGVMLFAKSEAIAEKLRERWNETTEKFYLARVQGRLKSDHGVFESYLKEDADGYRVRSVRPLTPGAKRSKTEWWLRGTEVLVRLHSGRKNQIRVHFSEAGYPIVGDEKYGGGKASRLYLHSWKLKFRHPISGKEFCFTAESPDFSNPMSSENMI